MFKNTFFFFGFIVSFLFNSGNMVIADDQIMIPRDQVNMNSNANPNSTTPVQAIVVDKNGNVAEQQYPYNPNTQTVIINNDVGGDNASIFFPMLAMGFIWWGGHWVDHDGYYYSNNTWVHVDNNNWNNHWNNYWNKHWDNHWHNHWNKNKQNPNFRYRNQEHWDRSSFQRGRGAGGQQGPRGGGDRGGGGHGGNR